MIIIIILKVIIIIILVIMIIIQIFIQVKAFSVPRGADINKGPLFKLKPMHRYK